MLADVADLDLASFGIETQMDTPAIEAQHATSKNSFFPFCVLKSLSLFKALDVA